MKKILMAAAVFVTLLSCGNSGTSNEAKGKDADSGYNDVRGVENANGNIPDTTATGATPHSDHPPIDSTTTADSVHK